MEPLVNTLVIDISPRYDGTYSLGPAVNPSPSCYVPSNDVKNLYVAMEGYTEDFKGDFDDVIFQLCSWGEPVETPVIFDISVLVDGKFLLTTHDSRMQDSGYITNIAVDNLYTAMEGLSRRYQRVDKFAFRINSEYVY